MNDPTSSAPCRLEICRNRQFWSFKSNEVVEEGHDAKQKCKVCYDVVYIKTIIQNIIESNLTKFINQIKFQL